MDHTKPLLLAGDIGATKTTLALYTAAILHQEGAAPQRQETFQNRAFTRFDDMLAVFLGAGGPLPPYACIGIAGPVLDNRVDMTNLNWRLDAQALQQRHGFASVCLINDLVATAMAIPGLGGPDLSTINHGLPPRSGALAVLAPGTGLGQAFLIPLEDGFLPCPSEGGHTTFAPRNAEQLELLAFMRQRQAHVSVEQVCSGLAVPNLFAFISTRHPVPEWLQREVEQAEDPTPVIVEAARRAVAGKRVCRVAVHTMQLLCDILADEAANLALKTLALGGVYLGGGLAPRLRPFLQAERFMAIFTREERSAMLAHIPVHIILNPQAALRGACAYALRTLIPPQDRDLFRYGMPPREMR